MLREGEESLYNTRQTVRRVCGKDITLWAASSQRQQSFFNTIGRDQIMCGIILLICSLSTVAVTGMATILQFDGSLRPPRDPISGFTYFPYNFDDGSSKQPLDGMDRLASCGATISIQSSTDGGEERLIAIGGRYLPNVPGLTSADTEYDGLLLGLEWLVHTISSDKYQEKPTMSMFTELNDVESQTNPKLIIRGDCKAVIDQLNSKSVPRKMEEKYNLAISYINTLYDEHHRIKCESLALSSSSASKDLEISFEHIPRENNHLCDAICKLVINQKQLEVVRTIYKMILLGEEDASNSVEPNSPKNSHVKRKKSKKKLQPKSEHFQQAFNSICTNPQLCHSSRLALACELARASMRQKDIAVIGELSDFFLQVSRRWAKIYYLESVDDTVGREKLRKVSIACKTLSENFVDVFLEEPKCVGVKAELCDEIESLLRFCTHSRSQDSDDENNTDSSVGTIILKPYTDISEMISSVEVETWKREIKAWSDDVSGEINTTDENNILINRGGAWTSIDGI